MTDTEEGGRGEGEEGMGSDRSLETGMTHMVQSDLICALSTAPTG